MSTEPPDGTRIEYDDQQLQLPPIPAKISRTKTTGWTPLIIAAANGQPRLVQRFLQRGDDPNEEGEKGVTPIIVAADRGHEAVVELLLASGANPNAICSGGITPLILATTRGHEAVARRLLEGGADVNFADDQGKTALIWAVLNTIKEPAIPQIEHIVADLLDHGADVNHIAPPGFTALQFAAGTGTLVRVPIIEHLLAHGANVNSAGFTGITPLMAAAASGNQAVFERLIASGADINLVDPKGRTALMHAARRMPDSGHVTIMEWLLGHGADPNIADADGETPLPWAAFHHSETLVKLLIRYGAHTRIRTGGSAGRIAREWLSGRIDRILQELKVAEDNTLAHVDEVMGETAAFRAAAKEEGFSVAEFRTIVDNAKAAKGQITTRKTTGAAKAKLRLKWDDDRVEDENPALFVARAYAAEMAAGTLHRGIIGKEDPVLQRKLSNWLRTHDMPPGIDIPTKPEWTTRQLAKSGKPPRAVRVWTEEGRLHEAARYRDRASRRSPKP